MILESIVTTVDRDGRVNLAPMGPQLAGDLEPATLTLRPFESSRTCENLIQTRAAVVHVTDDALLFARAAVDRVGRADQIAELVRPIEGTPWRVLKDCHRWFAVTVESVAGGPPRFEMPCRVRQSGLVRPFFGFNRAKHAVIEAAILATRTHLLSEETIRLELARLTPLVEKTAGPNEQLAFDLLREVIDERLTHPS